MKGDDRMRHVALLRGINVGGKTVVPMADLRAELTKLGFSSVRTCLNSGNALFESDLSGPALEEGIERALEKRFGLRIPALVLSAAELRAVVDGLTFSAEQIEFAQAAAGDAASLYVAFLSAPPQADALTRLGALKKPGELFVVSGRAIYLLLEHSIRECRLFSGLDKLDGRATVRNWNTVRKLDDMLGE